MRPMPLAAAALAIFSGAACQSEGSVNREPHTGTGTASARDGIQQITITTGKSSNDFCFHPSTIVVHPGKVRILLVNQGKPGAGAPHDWSLSGHPDAFVPLIAAGTRDSAVFTAPRPGRYQFVCTIHTRQGQTGTLVVKAA